MNTRKKQAKVAGAFGSLVTALKDNATYTIASFVIGVGAGLLIVVVMSNMGVL